MDTIISYLDNMFINFPDTPEVIRAKEDLAEMMEDKYNELLAEGKKENEAIGIVISEFGNIQEIADELGIGHRQEKPEASQDMRKVIKEKKTKKKSEKSILHLSNAEAEEYLFAVKQAAGKISAGVMLCICSPILIILLAGIQDNIVPISDGIVVGVGVTVLLILVASAVGLFISTGMKMETYEYLKKECFIINEEYQQALYQMRDSRRGIFKFKIIAGVMMCILSVVPLILVSGIFQNAKSDLFPCIATAILLFIVGAAVSLFISAEMEEESYKVILQEKEFAADKKTGKKIMETISAIYWPLIAALYLVWSFVSGKWGITWIIWPLAGILFEVIGEFMGNREHN